MIVLLGRVLLGGSTLAHGGSLTVTVFHGAIEGHVGALFERVIGVGPEENAGQELTLDVIDQIGMLLKHNLDVFDNRV